MDANKWVCECVNLGWKHDHRPSVRTVSNGVPHWGVWCRVCGSWQTLPKSAVDQATAEPFDPDRKNAFMEEAAEDRDAKHQAEWEGWRNWYWDWYLHTDHWKALRAEVLDRDRLCVGCRQRTPDQVHHLTYERLGCELLTDLVGLCADCHHRTHRHNRAMCPCPACIHWRGGERVPKTMSVALGR